MGRRDFDVPGGTYGEYIVIRQLISALAGAANVNFAGFNKNNKIRLEILDFFTIQTAAGPAASSTLQLRRGDGAVSEAFTNISNALAIGTIADETVTRATTISDAGNIVEVNQSINLLSVAASGTHNCIACVVARVLPAL